MARRLSNGPDQERAIQRLLDPIDGPDLPACTCFIFGWRASDPARYPAYSGASFSSLAPPPKVDRQAADVLGVK